jgi:hypothetical protein
MRLWVSESERRPNPEPVKTDDRKPIVLGFVAWLVALAIVAFVPGDVLPGDSTTDSVVWTCVAGIVLGAILFAYTHFTRRS